MSANMSFVKMFDEPGANFDPLLLKSIAKEMQSKVISGTRIPSGYTYFGQFVAHDLSHFAMSHNTSHGESKPLDELMQLATPTLDLNNLYGKGYGSPNTLINMQTGEFILGHSQDENGTLHYGKDLPRYNDKSPAIPDRRDDDNFILAQMHLQLMKLHNILIRKKKDEIKDVVQRFQCVKALITIFYQHALVFDFLKKILDESIWIHYFENADSRDVWSLKGHQALCPPIEFAFAAFRFGHSMVLDDYKINNDVKQVSIRQLMRLTYGGSLDGNPWLPKKYEIEWSNFFNCNGKAAFNKARKINPSVNLNVEGSALRSGGSLAEKNLLRGNEANLPCAQDIIRAINADGVFNINSLEGDLNPMQNVAGLTQTQFLPRAIQKRISRTTPLWYYILAEAHSADNKSKLGKLGSIVVASSIRQIIQRSPINMFDRDTWPSMACHNLSFLRGISQSNEALTCLKNIKIQDIINIKSSDRGM